MSTQREAREAMPSGTSEDGPDQMTIREAIGAALRNTLDCRCPNCLVDNVGLFLNNLPEGFFVIRETWFDEAREKGALEMAEMLAPFIDSAYWFYRMVDQGGPDGSELDQAVCEDFRTKLRELVPTEAYPFDEF